MARRLEPTLRDIGEAARALRAGRLVAFPTETVYGLGIADSGQLPDPAGFSRAVGDLMLHGV